MVTSERPLAAMSKVQSRRIALAYRLTARFQGKRRYKYEWPSATSRPAVSLWDGEEYRPVALRRPAVCPNLIP